MSDHQVWNELGNVYIISGELEQAINAYNKAINMNPKSGWAHNNIALAYIRSGQPHKAIEHYQRSIELFESFPDKAEAWHRLGNAYDMLGDIKNTLLAFERSTELAPEKGEYQESLVSALEKLPEDVQESFDKEYAAELTDRAIALAEAKKLPSIPEEVKDNLIPKTEEEKVDLDPGIEELMNQLSKEIEREVNNSEHTEKKLPEKPRWLDLDGDEDEDNDEDNIENDVAEEEPAFLESEDFEEAEETLDAEEFDEEIAVLESEVDEGNTEVIEEDKDVFEEDGYGFEEYEEEYETFENEILQEDELENEEFTGENTSFKSETVTVDEETDDDLVEENQEFDKEAGDESDESKDVMQNATVWGEMGNIFFNSDAYDGALIAYEKALELDGDYGAVMHNLALLHMNRGEYERAIEFYQKSIEMLKDASSKAITWNHLGNAYRAIRDYANASEAYRKADEINVETAAFESKKCQDLLSTKLNE